jgi:hypothetical protein
LVEVDGRGGLRYPPLLASRTGWVEELGEAVETMRVIKREEPVNPRKVFAL